MSLNSDDSSFADFFDEIQDSSQPENINFRELESIENRYEHLELIGSGGTKSVGRVYDKYACREIAMALLANDAGSNPFDAFLHEARLTAQLDHPNIIKVHDVGIENGRPFFTMDLKTGKSLREIIQDLNKGKSELNLNEKLAVFLKVCDAISYAHSKGVIHLDLKPDNIQVGSYGEVILCDWGLSATTRPIDLTDIGDNLYTQNLLMTKSNNFHCAGTPGFMAPEQYSKSKKNTEQTDVYGLGALLYSLLTLTPPLSGDLKDVKEAAEEGRIPSPLSLGIKLPEALDAIILKAMSANPEDRYTSASALAQDIRLYMEGFTCSVEQAGFLKEYARLTMRNPKISAVIYLSLILIITMTSLFVVSLNKSKRDAEGAHDETELANRKLKASLIKAEEAQFEAEKAQGDAEKSLAKYEAEKAAYNDLAKSGLAEKIKLAKHKSFHDPIPNIATLIRLYSQKSDEDSKIQLARSYFIAGNLYKAHEIFRKESLEHDQKLQRLVQKYAPKKEESLSSETLKNILADARNLTDKYRPIILRLVLYDRVQRKDFTNYESILQLTMQYFWKNPELKITYSSDGVFKVHTPKVGRFIFNHYGTFTHYFKFLPIKEIDLSNTDFYFLKDLGGLRGLTKLNISGTKVNSMSDFEKTFLALEELTARDLKERYLNGLPSRVKLIR